MASLTHFLHDRKKSSLTCLCSVARRRRRLPWYDLSKVGYRLKGVLKLPIYFLKLVLFYIQISSYHRSLLIPQMLSMHRHCNTGHPMAGQSLLFLYPSHRYSIVLTACQLHWQAAITMSMPWNGFHGWPISFGPIYQGMAQQPQHHIGLLVRALIAINGQGSAWRNFKILNSLRGWLSNKIELQIRALVRVAINGKGLDRQCLNIPTTLHESFGTVVGDCSFNFNPGHARI